MGIAGMAPGGDATPAALVQAADAVLYQAKAEGRNRYRVSSAAADTARA
jgi:PleD family two-component response regulator